MQEKDFKWFLNNYDDLFKKYGRSYLAIKNETVLGVYDTFIAGVRNTQKKEKLGTFIVQYCNGEESGYTEYIASMNFIEG